MQQTKCQDEYMQQAKCFPCNKLSVITNEYTQQAKCQDNTCNKAGIKMNAFNKPSVTHAINQVS